jgi:sugar O-acyltransferase (sialic acid O-acetyltransferase NeuD family)
MQILLYGASGHAAVVADAAQAMGYEVAGLFADEASTRPWGSIPYLGPYQPTLLANIPIVLAIGDNAVRQKLAHGVKHAWATVIHPSALVSPSAVVGEGTVVFHGAIVQAGAVLGQHCIINTGATVDHDCVIGDFAHIAPGVNLCGGVMVGEGTLIGVGAKIIPGVTIGANSIIGAGSVVLRDVEDGVTVVGVVG